MWKRVLRALNWIIFIVSLVATGYYGYNVYIEMKEEKQTKVELSSAKEIGVKEVEIPISELKDKESTLEVVDETGSDTETVTKEETVTKRVIDIPALQSQINQDIKGWITIAGTNIDEPVLQSKNSNEFYLYRGIYGEKNGIGSIYMDKDNSSDFTDTATYLFGHHTYNDLKLSQISLYENPDFLKQNKFFTIYTELGEEVTYEIIGFTVVKPITELFPATKFVPEDMDKIKGLLKQQNLDEPEVNQLSNDSKLLFLITCESFTSTANRNMVVAKRIN